MTTGNVVLGGFVFQDHEVPAQISFGGKREGDEAGRKQGAGGGSSFGRSSAAEKRPTLAGAGAGLDIDGGYSVLSEAMGAATPDVSGTGINKGGSVTPLERLGMINTLSIGAPYGQIGPRIWEIGMQKELETLLEAARKAVPSPEQQEEQRRSFAYGNTAFENNLITREMINEQAEAIARDRNQEHRRR
jgi:hypothetical protein